MPLPRRNYYGNRQLCTILNEYKNRTISRLILLVIGNGFFKPNISTLLGELYSENDSRRDSAFTIFYMGINVGAFSLHLFVDFSRRFL